MDAQEQGNQPLLTERRMLLLGLLAIPSAAGAAVNADAALYKEESTTFQSKRLEQRVQELVDREEIRELIARYAHRVAHGASPADLFTDDGVFITRYPDRPNRESHGRAELDKRFSDVAKSASPSLPMIHNQLIKIDGDKAAGLCSNELRMTENGISMIGSGYYEDQFRREHGQWKFVVRDMTFIHFVPLKEGWSGSPAAKQL